MVSVQDEVDTTDLAMQSIGFSPSSVRTSMEGKTAIYNEDRRLSERRSSLMSLWSRAKMKDDREGMDKIWQEVQGFNEKNPKLRITRINLMQSYKNRQRRIDKSEDGIYLSKKREGTRDAGYLRLVNTPPCKVR